MFPGVFVAPRNDVDPGLDPSDVVTPSQAAKRLDVPPGTVSSWISRKGVEPIGRLGRYNVYDYRELAQIEALMRYRPDAA